MSSKAKSKKPVESLRPGLLSFMRLLAIAAFLLSGYLAYVSLSSSTVAGCGPDSSCDRVLHSRWGYWLGLPVSLLAMILYAVVFAFLLKLNPKRPLEIQRGAWRVLFPCALLVLGAALWFIGVQAIALKSFCPWCMATHITGSVLGFLILLHAPIRQVPEKTWQAEKAVLIPPALAKKLAGVAVFGFAVLVAGQTLYRKDLSKEESVADNLPKMGSNAAVSSYTAVQGQPQTPASASVSNQVAPPLPVTATAGQATAAGPVARPNPLADVPRPGLGSKAKVFEFYQGRFAVDLNEVPLIGSPTAPRAIVSLFDYTCHHCRETHPIIMQTHQAFGEQLAIVSLPMPLDSKCNFTVKRTPPSHADACEYARLGLAVWHGNRKAHPQFDEFIFTPSEPPPIESARQYAAQLVGGPANLEKALSDGWVNQYLKLGIDVYATNYIHVGNGSMPQIIVGSRLATGSVTTEKLRSTIAEQLGLQPRP